MNNEQKMLILGIILGLVIGIDFQIYNYRTGFDDGKEQGLYNCKLEEHRAGIEIKYGEKEINAISEYANTSKK